MTRFCVEVENVDNTSTADVAYLLPANDAFFFFFQPLPVYGLIQQMIY